MPAFINITSFQIPKRTEEDVRKRQDDFILFPHTSSSSSMGRVTEPSRQGQGEGRGEKHSTERTEGGERTTRKLPGGGQPSLSYLLCASPLGISGHSCNTEGTGPFCLPLSHPSLLLPASSTTVESSREGVQKG